MILTTPQVIGSNILPGLVLDLLSDGDLDTLIAASRPGVRRVSCVAGPAPVSPRATPRPSLAIPPFRGETALIGCALPFGEVARVEGGLECVWPGAFATFLRSGPRVTAGVNHRPGEVLGSTHDGGLKLEANAAGLMFWLRLSPERDLDRAVLGAATLGQIGGVSVEWNLGVCTGQRDGELLTVRSGAISGITIAIGLQPVYTRTSAAIDSPKTRRKLERAEMLGW